MLANKLVENSLGGFDFAELHVRTSSPPDTSEKFGLRLYENKTAKIPTNLSQTVMFHSRFIPSLRKTLPPRYSSNYHRAAGPSMYAFKIAVSLLLLPYLRSRSHFPSSAPPCQVSGSCLSPHLEHRSPALQLASLQSRLAYQHCLHFACP